VNYAITSIGLALRGDFLYATFIKKNSKVKKPAKVFVTRPDDIVTSDGCSRLYRKNH